MTCVEFKEIAALFAAGTLDPADRLAAEQHLGEQAHDGEWWCGQAFGCCSGRGDKRRDHSEAGGH